MTRTAAIGISVLLLACAGEAGRNDTGSTVTNVAGVLHVNLRSLPPERVPQLHAEEVFTTAARHELFHVTAARFLEGGDLALANAGTSEILVLDASGALAHRSGGSGEGPGEFAWISALDVDTSGNILAYDPRQGRLTRMTVDGSVIETRPLSPPNRIVDLQPLAELNDGRIAAVYADLRVFAAGGEARDTIPLMLFDADGARADTLGMWPATEWAFIAIPRGASRSPVGFGGSAAYAGRNGRFAIGSTDTLDVVVYGADGELEMRIAGGVRAEVDPADVERWRQDVLASRSQAPEELRRALADVPYRSTYPAFADLALDDAGRIWIGSYARPAAVERDWIVIGTDGAVDGRLTLPASSRILDIAGDRIAVLSRDALDEEYVSVHRLM